MNAHDNRWSTLDLEMYLDDEMDSVRHSALTDALRRDHTLRERIARIARADDALRNMFVNFDEMTATHGEVRRYIPVKRALSAAACVAAILTLSIITGFYQIGQPDGPARFHVSSTGARQPENSYEAVRIVVSIPSNRTHGRQTVASNRQYGDVDEILGSVSDLTRDDQAFLRRLRTQLSAGGIENSTQLLGAATDHQRRMAFAAIGELLRSAEAARDVLDHLSPREQVAACHMWAMTTTLRSLAFERLGQLLVQPEYTNDVQAVLTSLRDEPILSKWIRSSQLRT